MYKRQSLLRPVLHAPSRHHVVDEDGNNIVGAHTHAADVVAGRGVEDWTEKGTGVSNGGPTSAAITYSAQRAYSKTSGADGLNSFTGTDKPLLATKMYNDRPGQNGQPSTLPFKQFAYRGNNNDDSDILSWTTDAYLYLSFSEDVEHKSDLPIRKEHKLLADPSITERVMADVAAYTGLAVNHAAMTRLITATAMRNLDELYDWLKWHKLQTAGIIYPTRETMVANADGTVLDIGNYNLTVGTGGILEPGTKFRSIRTTGLIQTTGTGEINVGYQDSTGKSLLINLGAENTAIVYSAANPTINPTYVAPAAGKTSHSIKVGLNSSVSVTAKRLGYDYRKYAAEAAQVADISDDLPRNPNVDTDDIIDMQNLLHWPQLASGVYGGNIYVDKESSLPHTLRLGNVQLSGSPVLTRALFDRRMLTQPGMEITHEHDDAGRGRAYDIYRDRIRLDDAWMVFGRQPITVPPNPAQGDGRGVGALWKVSRWGLYVTRHDDLAALEPPLIDDYVVIIDPLATQYAPTPGDISLGSQAVVNTPAFRDALGDAAADAIRPELEEVDDDVKALGQQIRSLPIDELLQVDSRSQLVPLTTDMANIWTGVPGTIEPNLSLIHI